MQKIRWLEKKVMTVDAKKRKKKRVLIIILIAVLLPILGRIAYVEITFFLETPGSVTIISGGEEHEGLKHYFLLDMASFD